MASPADGAVLPASSSVTFDVPEGSGWGGVWKSRLLITPGGASDLANSWGSWGFLDYQWLRDRYHSLLSEAAARGGAGFNSEWERAQLSFYSSGLDRDADRQSLFGPTFKIVAYGYEPTVSVWFAQGGTYTWQARYIWSWNYPAEIGMQFDTAPKSFTITAPPVGTPLPGRPTPSKAATPAPAAAPVSVAYKSTVTASRTGKAVLKAKRIAVRVCSTAPRVFAQLHLEIKAPGKKKVTAEWFPLPPAIVSPSAPSGCATVSFAGVGKKTAERFVVGLGVTVKVCAGTSSADRSCARKASTGTTGMVLYCGKGYRQLGGNSAWCVKR